MMPNKNSDNPRVGKAFQRRVQSVLENYFSEQFVWEPSIAIGNPSKDHKFDLSSLDQSIVVECKCYSWTDAGNVPSAKLMGLDEAIFYFSFLPKETKKILCMKKTTHPTKAETLAEYYVRVHGHLLSGVNVFEIDDEGKIKQI